MWINCEELLRYVKEPKIHRKVTLKNVENREQGVLSGGLCAGAFGSFVLGACSRSLNAWILSEFFVRQGKFSQEY